MKRLRFLLFFSIIFLGIISLLQVLPKRIVKETNTPKSTPSPVPTLSPTPTPRPLTLAEMNLLYGPCVRMPALMYHHIQGLNEAKEKNQTALTVTPEFFRNQMQYLKDKGYAVVSVDNLITFFDSGVVNPSVKAALITFDDAYEDFYRNAYPILKEFGYKAVVFVPTGLVNNPGYLSWDQINEMASSGILFANHTWSHKNVAVSQEVLEREISTADLQLFERGLNSSKVFAYPYGLDNQRAISLLEKLNYKLAFTTRYGSVQCTKQRLDLPRIRIGNSNLSNYGF